MSKEPATQPRYGVSPASIHIMEAAPGAVSSMEFTIDDPGKVISIADGAEIVYEDFVRGIRWFGGFIQNQRISPAFGQQGRTIDVTCYGYEALLDSCLVPTTTIAATDAIDGAGTVCIDFTYAQQFGAYAPVRTFINGSARSTRAFPVSGTASKGWDVGGTAVLIEGQTVRRAIEIAMSAIIASNPTVATACTVDFYRGLRFYPWATGFTTFNPSDYVALTVSDVAGTRPEGLTYEIDTSPSAMANAVYVKGANAAGTGWVVGDTRTGRHDLYVTSTAASDISRQSVGASILGSKSKPAARGTFRLENFTPVDAHPGSMLTITNAALGWSSKAFEISQIEKSINNDGTQNWTVSFFDAAYTPATGQSSVSSAVRRLTRTQTN